MSRSLYMKDLGLKFRKNEVQIQTQKIYISEENKLQVFS